jgi:hypothetical protein
MHIKKKVMITISAETLCYIGFANLSACGKIIHTHFRVKKWEKVLFCVESD